MSHIILIGGMPRCGKSTFGEYLVKAHSAALYSTDILCEAIGATFLETGLSVHVPQQERIKKFSPLLDMLVKTMSFQNRLFVIEGDAISPALIKKAVEKYQGHVAGLVFGHTSVTSEELRKRTGGGYDWISERSDEEVEGITKLIQDKSKEYKVQCAELGIIYHEFNMENLDEELKDLSRRLKIVDKKTSLE